MGHIHMEMIKRMITNHYAINPKVITSPKPPTFIYASCVHSKSNTRIILQVIHVNMSTNLINFYHVDIFGPMHVISIIACLLAMLSSRMITTISKCYTLFKINLMCFFASISFRFFLFMKLIVIYWKIVWIMVEILWTQHFKNILLNKKFIII